MLISVSLLLGMAKSSRMMLLIKVPTLVADINGTVSTFSPVGILVALGTYVIVCVRVCEGVLCVMYHFIRSFSSRMKNKFYQMLL